MSEPLEEPQVITDDQTNSKLKHEEESKETEAPVEEAVSQIVIKTEKDEPLDVKQSVSVEDSTIEDNHFEPSPVTLAQDSKEELVLEDTSEPLNLDSSPQILDNEASPEDSKVILIEENVNVSVFEDPSSQDIVIIVNEETTTLSTQDIVIEQTELRDPVMIQKQLDDSTSIIDNISLLNNSLKDENHPQLERPGIKAPSRRKKTNPMKTFAQLQEEEKKREEDLKKPREKTQVDQVFTDPYDLLSNANKNQRHRKSWILLRKRNFACISLMLLSLYHH